MACALVTAAPLPKARTDLGDVDVKSCRRVIFIGDHPAVVVAAATLGTAMAPRSVEVCGAFVRTSDDDARTLDDTLAAIGLLHPARLAPSSSFRFRADDLVITIDCAVDADPAQTAELVIGNPMDAATVLGEAPRGPLLAGNDGGVDVRRRFVVGLLREHCQALFERHLNHAWATSGDGDGD